MPVSDKLASAESSQYVMGEKRDGLFKQDGYHGYNFFLPMCLVLLKE